MPDVLRDRPEIVLGGGLLVLVAVLFLVGEEQSLVIGIISGAAYGLLALGLVLIYKSSGVFNFDQGASPCWARWLPRSCSGSCSSASSSAPCRARPG